MGDSEEAVPRERKLWSVLYWCLPSLVGFVIFLVSFPIYRRTPFWPYVERAEIFAFWFLFITPVTTLIAVVIPVKRRRCKGWIPTAVAGLAIAVSLLANLFVLLGMAG
jgi:hypothetical protein